MTAFSFQSTAPMMTTANKRPTYGFPVGEGNLKEAIELIEEDSAKRGYGIEMFGLNNECVKKVEEAVPRQVRF